MLRAAYVRSFPEDLHGFLHGELARCIDPEGMAVIVAYYMVDHSVEGKALTTLLSLRINFSQSHTYRLSDPLVPRYLIDATFYETTIAQHGVEIRQSRASVR